MGQRGDVAAELEAIAREAITDGSDGSDAHDAAAALALVQRVVKSFPSGSPARPTTGVVGPLVVRYTSDAKALTDAIDRVKLDRGAKGVANSSTDEAAANPHVDSGPQAIGVRRRPAGANGGHRHVVPRSPGARGVEQPRHDPRRARVGARRTQERLLAPVTKSVSPSVAAMIQAPDAIRSRPRGSRSATSARVIGHPTKRLLRLLRNRTLPSSVTRASSESPIAAYRSCPAPATATITVVRLSGWPAAAPAVITRSPATCQRSSRFSSVGRLREWELRSASGREAAG